VLACEYGILWAAVKLVDAGVGHAEGLQCHRMERTGFGRCSELLLEVGNNRWALVASVLTCVNIDGSMRSNKYSPSWSKH
jgi:hypothetical protein